MEQPTPTPTTVNIEKLHKGFRRWASRVGGLRRIYHLILPDPSPWSFHHRRHVGVVVRADGRCTARSVRMPSSHHYNRKLWYYMAVGQALRMAADPTYIPAGGYVFWVDNELEGNDLRRAVYEKLVACRILEPPYAG